MKKRILLVDDSQTILGLLSALLMNAGCDLLLAENAEGALKTAFLEQPDLVISDVQMPGMTGIELCRLLRGAPQLRGTRLVLMSGSWTQEGQDEARRIGVDACLDKPFDPDHLATMVADLLA